MGSSMKIASMVARVAAALALGGCAGDLPLAERIASVRPLAVRIDVVDPPPADDEAVRAEALPLETVRLSPLFADPDGPWSSNRIASLLDPVWIACTMEPVQGVFGCITEARPLDPADVPDCPPVDPGAFDPSNPQLRARPSPCRLVVDDAGAPELTVPLEPAFLLGGDLEVTMIGHVPDEGSTSACLEAVLEDGGDPDDSCVIVSQRVPVGPDGRLVELAEDLGVPIEGLPPLPDPIPDADRNPRIVELRVAVFEDPMATAPDQALVLERGARLVLPAGARIEVEVEAREDDLQTFAIPSDMGTYASRDEDYQAAWFRTWGDLLAPESDDPTAQNTWTLVPGEQDEDIEQTGLPPTGVATLLYVLRDGRSGVDWTWFSVEVTGPAPM
jgi:hypothetical protein